MLSPPPVERLAKWSSGSETGLGENKLGTRNKLGSSVGGWLDRLPPTGAGRLRHARDQLRDV